MAYTHAFLIVHYYYR